VNTNDEFTDSASDDTTDRRRAEVQLRQSEEKYRRLAENMSDVVWTTDFNLKTTCISPSVVRLVGESVEAHLRRTVEEKFPPASLAKMSAIFVEEMELEKDPDCDRNRSRMIEVEHYRADGSTIRVSIHCSFVRDENGTAVGLQGVTRDITARKAAEESIRHSNDLMRYIIEHTNSGVAIHDRDLRYIYVSQRYLDQYNVVEEDVIGKLHYDVFPDLPQKWRDVHQRALAGEVSSAERDPYLRGDGTVEWTRWECRPWYEASGSIGGIVVYTEVITDQVKAEEALRRSEAYQCAMIAASPLAIIGLTPDGQVRSWNDAAERIFGWAAPEVVGRYLPIVPEDQQDASAALRRRIMNGESMANLELTRQRRDGTPIAINLSTSPIRDPNGRPAAIMLVYEDITERKAAEKRLNWNIRRNALLSDTAASLLQNDDPQSLVEGLCQNVMEFLDCQAFFNFLQEPQMDKLRLNACAGISDEARKQIEWLEPGVAVCGCVARDRRRMIFENILDTADPATDLVKSYGIQAYVCHPLMIQDRLIGTLSFGSRTRSQFRPEEILLMESVSNLVAIAMNRIRVENALRESEEKFRLLVESSPDAIFVQTEGRFAYLNQAAVRLFGARTADELIGANVIDRFHADYHKVVQERIRLLNQEQETVPVFEQVYIRIDGSLVNVEVSAVPFHYQGSNGALVFVRDISDRIERECANEQLQKQLVQAQKMESVGRLAGGVAHDFNNMLGVILGYTELALEKLAPQDPLCHDLQEILAATNRSADITRQLLAFSRQQPISPKVLDLNETVEDLLKMLRRLLGEDIYFSWHPGARSSTVYMDPSQLDQVLVNLCVNARDAIHDVGRISIETGNRSFDHADCHDNPGSMPGDFVLLSVSDNGCGMNAETLERVFEPFFTTKPIGQGTGLGLATVYGIVKQNNGFINVYSELDQGTTFRIYLPRHEAIEEIAPKKDPEVPDARGSETLLLVEDDSTILAMTTMMLERLGYRVLPAGNPEQAIALAGAQTDPIDLLITDVVMPEMNGRELSARLRELYPALNVLFMSGYTADVIAYRGVLEKGENFIQKPFFKKDLAAKVREVLEAGHHPRG
jgi:PAS domain S-box-containing protein